jgi:hypothetical protein
MKRTKVDLLKKTDQSEQSLVSTIDVPSSQQSENDSIESRNVNSSEEDEFVVNIKEKNATSVTAKKDVVTLRLPKNPSKSQKNLQWPIG